MQHREGLVARTRGATEQGKLIVWETWPGACSFDRCHHPRRSFGSVERVRDEDNAQPANTTEAVIAGADHLDLTAVPPRLAYQSGIAASTRSGVIG